MLCSVHRVGVRPEGGIEDLLHRPGARLWEGGQGQACLSGGSALGMRIALLKQRGQLRAQTGTLREAVRDASAIFDDRIPPTAGLIVWLIAPLEQMQDESLEIRAEIFPRTASQVCNLLDEVLAVELVPFPCPQERDLLLRPEVKILCIELGVAHGSSPISGHRPLQFRDTHAEGIERHYTPFPRQHAITP